MVTAMDETKKKKMRRQDSRQLNTRFLIFAALVMITFSILVYGIYQLQIVEGAEHAQLTGASAVKSIPIKGTRGMITDKNSVVLAKSEKIYNVTFYREEDDWDYPSKMLLETLEILERYESDLCVSAPIRRNETTGQWEFAFGDGISQTAWDKRQETFYRNNYFSVSKAYSAEECFTRLRKRYGFTDLGGGRYALQLDKYGVSIVPDADSPNKNPCVESYEISEETLMKVLAINITMQDNAFNAVPIVIAEDVPYEAVSEIEGRSMSMNWVGVAIGEKRVYPNGSLASNILGYTGKIQNADRYYNELQPAGYALNDRIGLDGIESSMENWLTANLIDRQGERLVQKDSTGHITREISYTPPKDGNTVKLTIDATWQAKAEEFIRNNVAECRLEQEKKMADSSWLEKNKDKIAYRNWDEYPLKLATTGVLLVMDMESGEMRAMAQYPTYDLNAMVESGDAAREIVTDERGLLMNYAIQTRAEPGSIFKMCTGLAALTNGELTPTETIDDAGPFDKYTSNKEEAPRCWTTRYSAHSNQTIVEGLTNSCNYFFYTLSSRLYGDTGTERLYKYAAEMGLTSKTGIELPGELRSVVGNQSNLYDPSAGLREQMTDTPIIVANAIKKHIRNYGASYGIEYDDAALDKCIRRLMEMAINTGSDDWVTNARPIFITELNMTREMVMQAALMSDLWNYLNTIKWGGSQEIQLGIGQSITLITPIAAVRYVGALSSEAKVWNPHIISSIISPEGEVLSLREASLYNTLESAKPYMDYILLGMEGVVDEGGTATSYFKDWKYKPKEVMAGKTGTSQVTIGGIKLDLENNAWFVALTPRDNPKIAIVSFIPNGMAGAQATRAARDFIGFYLDEQAKESEKVVLPGGNSLAP